MTNQLNKIFQEFHPTFVKPLSKESTQEINESCNRIKKIANELKSELIKLDQQGA